MQNLKPALKRTETTTVPETWNVGGLTFARTERYPTTGTNVVFNSVVQVHEEEDPDFGEEDFEGEEDEGSEPEEEEEGDEEEQDNGIASASTATTGVPAAPGGVHTIQQWYLHDSGRVVSSDPAVQSNRGPVPVKTSALKAANGLFVQTSSGSVYKLGRMDKKVAKVFKKVYPADAFDPSAPLDNPNARRALRFAGRVVHGEAADTWERMKLDLEILEEQLGAKDIVAPELEKIWKIFDAMGLER